MKYSHAVTAAVLWIFLVVAGGESGYIPYKFTLPVTVALAAVGIYYRFDVDLPFLGGELSFSGGSGMAVEPNNALDWLQNQKIPEINGYRKLNLDKTSSANMKLHTRIQKVNENGELKTKFGVVGRPLNQRDKESIAYVVHCDEGYIEYSGELHTAEDRLDPFNGKHSWLVNAGYKAKVEHGKDKTASGVNIYQGEAHRNNKGFDEGEK